MTSLKIFNTLIFVFAGLQQYRPTGQLHFTWCFIDSYVVLYKLVQQLTVDL